MRSAMQFSQQLFQKAQKNQIYKQLNPCMVFCNILRAREEMTVPVKLCYIVYIQKEYLK